MATLPSKRPEPDFIEHPDVDCVYRMIALACAAMVTGHTEDYTRVIALADMFFEYIDPLGAGEIDPKNLPGALR